jgi:hypothetical protein
MLPIRNASAAFARWAERKKSLGGFIVFTLRLDMHKKAFDAYEKEKPDL